MNLKYRPTSWHAAGGEEEGARFLVENEIPQLQVHRQYVVKETQVIVIT